MNNLKIYCQTEEDQSVIVEVIFSWYPEGPKVCTWEPDGDDENPGTWGMFVDNFSPELWGKLVRYLQSEHSWCLDENVEMALECPDTGVNKYYYQR